MKIKAHVFSAGCAGKDGKCEFCSLPYGAEVHAFYSYLEPKDTVVLDESQAILNSLIGTEDALEAIRDHVSMGDYVALHKAIKQDEAKDHYFSASDRIARCGTVRKALHDVQAKIAMCR